MNIPKKLNNNVGVKLSSTLSGQRELIREMRNKINELVEYLQVEASKEECRHKPCNGWGCDKCNQTGYPPEHKEASKGDCPYCVGKCLHTKDNYFLKTNRECGLDHKHNYYDCCAACLHGESPSEGASGHVKACKYYVPKLDPPEHEESPHGYKLRHEDCEDCIKATGDAWQPKMSEYVSKEKIKRVIEESADYTKYPHYGDYKIGTFMNIFQHGLEERARVIIESLGLGD